MRRNELKHHGIKGQKWGIRRYEGSDGKLTPAGKARYGSRYDNGGSKYESTKSAYKQAKKDYNKSYNAANSKRHQAFSLSSKKRQANKERWEDVYDKAKTLDKAKQDYKKAKQSEKNTLLGMNKKLFFSIDK